MSELQPSVPDTSSSVQLTGNEGATQNPADYKPEPKPEKPEAPKLTARQALEKAAEENKANEPKAEAKPAEKPKAELKAEEKPTEQPKAERERGENGKFAPKAQLENTETPETSDSTSEANGDGQDEPQDQSRPSEGRGNREPPARLLPRERDDWIKAPNSVRDGVLRITQEYEREIEQSREARENWSKLERFDQMAKARGVTIDRALEHYTGIDAKLSQDLVGGLDHIARQYGYDLRQVAQHVLQQPADQYQQQIVQQATQVTQEYQRLQGEMQSMAEQLQQAQAKIVHLETIQPFISKVGQERYQELEPYIANFLNSGMIPSSLSGQQKLETAFDMAERLFSRSQSSSSPSPVAPETDAKRVNPAGLKSIKGTPVSGADIPTKDKGKLSSREAIKAAMAQIGG